MNFSFNNPSGNYGNFDSASNSSFDSSLYNNSLSGDTYDGDTDIDVRIGNAQDSATTSWSGASSSQHSEEFAHRSIEDWTGEDCFNWAYSVSPHSSSSSAFALEDANSVIEPFKSTSGNMILLYTMEDFCELIDVCDGPLFYYKFKETVKTRQEQDSSSMTTLVNRTPASSHSVVPPLHNNETSLPYYNYANDAYSNLGNDYREPYYPNIANEETSLSSEGGCFNELDDYIGTPVETEMTPDLKDIQITDFLPEESSNSDHSYYIASEDSSAAAALTQQSSNAGDFEDKPAFNHFFKKIPAGGPRKNRVRGIVCWEFLLRLLQDPDPRTNSLIEWEDETAGIFRLQRKEDIARMWGERTGKHDGTYASFARLLRYHYDKGPLERVRESHMVYKFGPEVLKQIKEGKKW